jgi:hypothetical protein
MQDARRTPLRRATRSAGPTWVTSLPSTADVSGGASNLATRPRAGNISTDTRAGTPARSGV